MRQKQIETIIDKVEAAATWYGMYTEKLSANENWELYKDVYEKTIKEIEVLLND